MLDFQHGGISSRFDSHHLLKLLVFRLDLFHHVPLSRMTDSWQLMRAQNRRSLVGFVWLTSGLPADSYNTDQ